MCYNTSECHDLILGELERNQCRTLWISNFMRSYSLRLLVCPNLLLVALGFVWFNPINDDTDNMKIQIGRVSRGNAELGRAASEDIKVHHRNDFDHGSMNVQDSHGGFGKFGRSELCDKWNIVTESLSHCWSLLLSHRLTYRSTPELCSLLP